MGNALINDGLVLNVRVTGSRASQALPAVTADTPIMGFDPPERIFWAIRHGVQVGLGQDAWSSLQPALPNPKSADQMFEFVTGIAAGVRDSITDFVNQNLSFLAEGGGLLIGFYQLIFDVDVWVELAQAYADQKGIDEFRQFLQTNYSNLYTAIVAIPKLQQSFSVLVDSLTTKEVALPWGPAVWAIARWAVALSLAIGNQLRLLISDLVAAAGKVVEQGQIIGKVISNVIIQVVSIATGLFASLRGVAAAATSVLLDLRNALAGTSAIAMAVKIVADVSPGISEAGNEAAQGVKEAIRIYNDVAYRIAPYKVLTRQTRAFNSTVRNVAGYGLWDEQYLSMQLNAHHLVKDEFFKTFAADFKKVFGWQSANDMDTIALHYEWHISSPEALSQSKSKYRGFQYIAKEDRLSLSKALDKYLESAQQGPDGTAKPFAKLSELVQAHADFYKNYSSPLWQKVQPWFSQALAQIAAAGL